MATLTVHDISTAGVTPVYAAAAGGGDQFPNDGKTLVHLKNASGGIITATFVAQVACNRGTVHSSAVAVPITTGEKWCGPFDPAIYNDANGMCQITYSGVTTFTVAVGSL